MKDKWNVLIADDEPAARRGVRQLLAAFPEFEVAGECRNGAEVLAALDLSAPDVVFLDIHLPGLSGFELHSELLKANIHIPIIFITGHGDIPMSVRAMKAGAIDFITKPFRDQDMLDAVTAAINADRARLDAESARLRIQALFDNLTSREKEVMALVTTGLMTSR